MQDMYVSFMGKYWEGIERFVPSGVTNMNIIDRLSILTKNHEYSVSNLIIDYTG